MNEVTLFDHELVSALFGFERQALMVNEIRSECAASTSRRRIFGDVIGWCEEACVCMCRTNFNGLARECQAASCASARVNLREQRTIHFTVAQVRKRPDRDHHAGKTCADRLNR